MKGWVGGWVGRGNISISIVHENLSPWPYNQSQSQLLVQKICDTDLLEGGEEKNQQELADGQRQHGGAEAHALPVQFAGKRGTHVDHDRYEDPKLRHEMRPRAVLVYIIERQHARTHTRTAKKMANLM